MLRLISIIRHTTYHANVLQTRQKKVESSWSQSRVGIICKPREKKEYVYIFIDILSKHRTSGCNRKQLHAMGQINNCAVIYKVHQQQQHAQTGWEMAQTTMETISQPQCCTWRKHPVHLCAPHCESWSTNFGVLRSLPEIDFSLKCQKKYFYLFFFKDKKA